MPLRYLYASIRGKYGKGVSFERVMYLVMYMHKMINTML